LVLASVCLFLLIPKLAFAQASAGITGTVTDNSGAVVVDAHVTITNDATSVAEKTATSSTGTYDVKGLLPGKYTVQVDAQGFKKALQRGVTVEVSTNATVDITLSAGAADQSVEVTASQISLNVTQPELGSTIEPVVVAALPTEVSGRGRQIDALQFLAPGTTGDTFSHRVSGGVDFEQEIVYNGIPAPQPETEGYTTNFNPPYELVDEYKIERSTFSAQFGLGQGALTYQMKSGTNTYHGDAFEINRNSFFDSVGFFNGPAWEGRIRRRWIARTTTDSASADQSAFRTSMTAATRPSVITARSGTSRTTRTPMSPLCPRCRKSRATSTTWWTPMAT
jgi:hypothetical protein